MRKSSKFVSALLAALMAVSSFSILSAVTVSAANDTKVYFDVPDWWGPVKWNSKHTMASVYCHLYKIYGGSDLKETTFATKTERCTWEHDNVYSFDTTTLGTIEEGADYGIIFCADNTSSVRHQTCDMTMGIECLGDTMIATHDTRINGVDSEKFDYVGEWTDPTNKELFGAMNLIDSLGNFLGGKFPLNTPKPKLIADRLYDPAFKMKVNAKYFTTERLNELEAELGVTARDVYDQYVITYKDILEEKIANGDLVDKYDKDGNPEFLVPTFERVAERLGITIEDETTAEPTTEPIETTVEPTTAEATTVEPTTAEPTTAEPTTAEPTTAEPTTAEPTTAEPTTAEPTTVESTTAEPTTAEPTTVEPTTAEPTTAEPTTVEPTTVEPTTVEPTTVPEPTTEPVTEPEPVYVVAGSEAFLGSNWNGKPESGNVMTKNGDVYTFTVNGFDAIDQEMQFKVVENIGDSQRWIGDENGQNVSFSVEKVTDVTVTYEPATDKVTVSGDGVISPFELVIKSVRIVGAADENKGNWLNGISWKPDADANLMEQNGDVYSITFNNLPEEMGYEFKIAANGNWNANWGLGKGESAVVNAPINATFNGENLTFDLDEESNVTVILDLTNFNKDTKEGAVITIDVASVVSGPIFGDVDGDGEISINDATEIQKFGVELIDFTDEQKFIADVDGDGRVSVLDVTCIQKYLAGFKTGTGFVGQDVNSVS
ncbi:MAG: dockerin type I domain-containing protein [Ruminococcus sp.]|nr:dockerin type I domain-containing protein [Ruminococcus sp.]